MRNAMNPFRRLSFLIGVGIALCMLPSGGTADHGPVVSQVDVPVSHGTDVAVGFGTLEPGLLELNVKLEAADSGAVITSSEAYDQTGVAIWNSPDSNTPLPAHLYTATGFEAEDSHTVRFRGFLRVTGGTGGVGPGEPPQEPLPDFHVAVQEIDIDCDSNNTGDPENYWAPDESPEEDRIEYPEDGNSASGAYGMLVTPEKGWSMIVVKANPRRPSRISLQVTDWQGFEFADAGFSLLQPLSNPLVSPEPDHTVLFEDDADNGPWTFYVRTGPSAQFEDSVTATAVLERIAPEAIESSHRAADKILVTFSDRLVLFFDLVDEEPYPDPTTRHASGINEETVAVTLNGSPIPLSRFHTTEIVEGGHVIGKHYRFQPESWELLSGNNLLLLYAEDIAGNTIDEDTDTFEFELP